MLFYGNYRIFQKQGADRHNLFIIQMLDPVYNINIIGFRRFTYFRGIKRLRVFPFYLLGDVDKQDADI